MWQPGCPGLVTQEGSKSVQEAIDFLKTVAPMDSLGYEAALQTVASSHANYLGGTGTLSHSSKNGDTSGKRIFGVVSSDFAAENLYAGQKSSTAESIVLALVIDDGVSSRGHRANIFNSQAHNVAVGIAPHAYGIVACMDFCGNTSDRVSSAPTVSPPSLYHSTGDEEHKHDFGEEPGDSDEGMTGYTEKSVSTKITQSGHKKTTVTTTVYKMKDGSTSTETRTMTETC